MKILRFEGSAHSETGRLLPWYVNQTLDDADQARVDGHLAQCEQCRREVAFLRSLRSVVQEPSPTPDPTASLLRLRERLQSPRAGMPPTRTRTTWSDWPMWLRGAMAASCVATVGLISLALYREQPAAMYRTLGDVPAARTVDEAGLRHLIVVFDPHIEHARMQQLLRASQARIVDGPNEAGAYVLAVPAGREASVRDALRAAAGVTLVESLDPAGPRQ